MWLYSISSGFENSEPLSVNITGNIFLNVSNPSSSSKLLKISIIDCASLCSLIKASIKEQFLKWMVSSTFPPFVPSTVSISTMFVSGFFSKYFK